MSARSSVAPKNTKMRRCTVSPLANTTIASTSGVRPATIFKSKIVPRSKTNSKTILEDVSMSQNDSQMNVSNGAAECRQIEFNTFLRSMLEECLVDEKIAREETQMDVHMTQLADRFQRSMNILDKTKLRLQEINFIVEQKRLIDLKSQDNEKLYEVIDKSNTQEILCNLADAEQSHLDQLVTRNVDFGFDVNSGHKQLLDAVNETIGCFEEMKKRSNLDMNKFKEYTRTQKLLEDHCSHKLDAESLKEEFEMKFPHVSGKVVKDTSQRIQDMFDEIEKKDDC